MAMAFQAFAQRTMRDFIISMPDSLVEYLNKTKRTEMVDFYDMGVKAETSNLLQGATVLDSLTKDFADISLNKSVRMQLALLPRLNDDSLICMVQTFMGEAPESEVAFFDTQWQHVDADGLLEKVPSSMLLHRPDTMTVERYEQLVRLLDPVMVAADVSPDKSITFSLSMPMTTKEEREELKSVILQKKLKWNGKRFN